MSARELLQKLGTVDLIHVYGRSLPLHLLKRTRTPWIATQQPPRRRFPFRNPSPAAIDDAPEAVGEEYFARARPKKPNEHPMVGSVLTAHAQKARDLTLVRIARFRDDIRWDLVEEAPSLEELRRYDAWIDPSGEEELDGGVAEALVAGVRVIATRTTLNSDRLAGGAAGVLVPVNDPNELAHAIVTVLFKPEKDAARVEYATASRDRFRPEHRAESLRRIYSGVIR